MTHDAQFVPQLRTNLLRHDLGLEAVLWSPIRAAPVALDPVATVMLAVVDGSATVADLVRDVQDVVGVPEDRARAQVHRIIDQFDRGGLLESSVPEPAADRQRELFANPLSSCMESSSCTGAVTPVNLEIGGYRLRVACRSRGVARRLRGALEAHLIEDQAPLGFMLRSSRRHPRRHVLVDRCGFVLGSADGTQRAMGMIGAHLSALLPVPEGRVRLRVRALVSDEGAVLCTWPVLFVPEPLEERLTQMGYAVVDRLAVDIDVATGAMVNVPTPWPSMTAIGPGRGHAAPSGTPLRLTKVVVAVPPTTASPTAPQVVVSLAREALGGSRADILLACRAAAAGAAVAPVDVDSPEDLYAVLRP